MAFPLSPTDGQIYDSPNGTRYIYHSTGDYWEKAGSTTGIVGSTGSVDNALVRSAGIDGRTVQATGILVSDTNQLVLPAASSIACTVFTLTDGATVSIDLSKSNDFKLTMGGSRTIALPSNMVTGKSGTLAIYASGGSYTPTFAAGWDWGAAGAPSFTGVSGKGDVCAWRVLDAAHIAVALAIAGVSN
jgi:hypothetical protein